ncbi:MAG: hypothetical protein JWN14_1080, partial [Chthonomonadales bacterium]|nr:hypothetical protein [Chthonomonadales bacterium]
MSFIQNYLTDVKSLIDALDERQIEALASHHHRIWIGG